MRGFPLQKSFLLTALISSFLLLLQAQAVAEMRIFKLQHRPAEGLVETVRTLAGDEGKVAAHGNLLVVNATPHFLSEIAGVVAGYDLPQRMLRVTVEQNLSTSSQEREVGATARLHIGSVALDLPNTGSGQSLGSISGVTQVGQASLRLREERQLEGRQTRQTLAVLEGSPAKLSIGRSVPFTSVMRSYCSRHTPFVETTYQKVDTGFEVLPQLFNDHVQLEIRPFMAFVDERSSDQIVFHELMTKVSIPFGSWYELGGQIQRHDDLSREILGGGEGSTVDQRSLRLRIDLE